MGQNAFPSDSVSTIALATNSRLSPRSCSRTFCMLSAVPCAAAGSAVAERLNSQRTQNPEVLTFFLTNPAYGGYRPLCHVGSDASFESQSLALSSCDVVKYSTVTDRKPLPANAHAQSRHCSGPTIAIFSMFLSCSFEKLMSSHPGP